MAHLKRQFEGADDRDAYNAALMDLVTRVESAQMQKQPAVDLSELESSFLKKEFEKASAVQSPCYTAMIQIASVMGVKNPSVSVYVADMKSWARAAEKLKHGKSDIHDLARGRILTEKPEQYARAYRACFGTFHTHIVWAHPQCAWHRGSQEPRALL